MFTTADLPAALLQHLPALQVVVPLLSAPIVLLLRNRWAAGCMAILASWLSFAIAGLLIMQVNTVGSIEYAMGGWAAPMGIALQIDAVNAFVLLIVTAVAAVVVPIGLYSVQAEVREDRVYLIFTAFLLCLAGLLGMTVTADVFNVFVFLEISSLSGYALISQGTDRRALTAAFRYLIIGTIGGTFVLIGIGLAYAKTGTLNMSDMAERLQTVQDSTTVIAAFAFIMVGLLIKIGAFPLHGWLPNAYTFAPSMVTAFLAGSATKVAVYVWLRFAFDVFGIDTAFPDWPVQNLLMGLAIAGMLIASIVAIFQPSLKRILAWSSVAQLGYIILGISFLSEKGLTAGIVHLFNHAMSKCALFIAVAAVVYRLGTSQLTRLAGIGRSMPLTSAAAVMAGLSLIGLPATTGFISKWVLVQAAVEQGLWLPVVAIVITSLLALVYVGRVLEVVYFKPRPVEASRRQEAPWIFIVCMWILVAAAWWFGIDSSFTVGISAEAAQLLLDQP